jgi:hypothetical protein
MACFPFDGNIWEHKVIVKNKAGGKKRGKHGPKALFIGKRKPRGIPPDFPGRSIFKTLFGAAIVQGDAKSHKNQARQERRPAPPAEQERG